MPGHPWRHGDADYCVCRPENTGVIGAAVSFIGFGLPAFVLMNLFAAVYTHAYNLGVVASAFSGLQAIIVAVVANAR